MKPARVVGLSTRMVTPPYDLGSIAFTQMDPRLERFRNVSATRIHYSGYMDTMPQVKVLYLIQGSLIFTWQMKMDSNLFISMIGGNYGTGNSSFGDQKST